MPKYNVDISIRLTISTNNRKYIKRHVKGIFKGAWWNNTTMGFSQDKFRADCISHKVLKIEVQK